MFPSGTWNSLSPMVIVTNFSNGRNSGPGFDMLRFYPKKTAAFRAAAVYRFSLIRKTLSLRKGSLRTHQRSRRNRRCLLAVLDTGRQQKLRSRLAEKRVECGQPAPLA